MYNEKYNERSLYYPNVFSDSLEGSLLLNFVNDVYLELCLMYQYASKGYIFYNTVLN